MRESRVLLLVAAFGAAAFPACSGSSAGDPASPPPVHSDDAGGGANAASVDAGTPGTPSNGGGTDDAGGGASPTSDAGNGPPVSPDAGAADAGQPADGGAAHHVAIPMYIDPDQSPQLWTQVFGAGGPVSLLIVSTDSEGAGTSVDPTFTTAIASAHAAGERVIGYTYTNSAQRAIATVEADVANWFTFYPALDGIFVDEVSDETSTAASYYVPLYTYIKGKKSDALVAINPGTMVDEAFMSASDILLTFEATYASFIDPNQNPPNPSWVAKYPSSRFWNIILSTSASDEANAITLAKGRNAGWIYVTSQGPDTAYQDIETGSYWTTELTDVTAP